MLGQLKSKIDGMKVHILVAVGILYALAGTLFGPIDFGPIQIPAMSPKEFWEATWTLLFGSAWRDAIKKVQK